MKIRYLLLSCLLGVLPLTSAHAFISITIAPPVLPVYAQPPCPVDGYLWTPGYWAYDDADGYYWTPGVWVAPPTVGYLWTPGYWGFSNGFYAFNEGYWGPTVGFYGGVNYGYGYGGNGYYGGRWEGRTFRYNTAVTRVNTSVVHNTFVDRTALSRQATHSRASFNGPGGISARPTGAQLAAARGPHIGPTGAQTAGRTTAFRTAASSNRFVRPPAGRTGNGPAGQRVARQGGNAGRVTPQSTSRRQQFQTQRSTPRGPQPQVQRSTPRGPQPQVQRSTRGQQQFQTQRSTGGAQPQLMRKTNVVGGRGGQGAPRQGQRAPQPQKQGKGKKP